MGAIMTTTTMMLMMTNDENDDDTRENDGADDVGLYYGVTMISCQHSYMEPKYTIHIPIWATSNAYRHGGVEYD